MSSLSAAFKKLSTEPQRFFASPAASGRQVVCSFSYVQRIGKKGAIDVWFPSELHEKIAKSIEKKDNSVLKELGIEWAAVREFSLIQESEYEEDFDPERPLKAWKDLGKWRGQDGYRITIIMLGNYTNLGDYDELHIQDQRLQQGITNLIHLLYLEKDSAKINEQLHAELMQQPWTIERTLPHLVMHLGSMGMTGRGSERSRNCAGIVSNILKLVEALPSSHVVHDVAVGLAIPDMDKKNHNDRLIGQDKKFSTFQAMMTEFFAPLGHKSMRQMRGFGALRSSSDSKNIAAARLHVK